MTSEQFSFRSQEEKKAYVRQMFSGIAKRYDFLNHFLSFGLDRRWRKRAIGIVGEHLRAQGITTPAILDIASGTGDLALEALRQLPAAKVTAIDPVNEMLDIFREKIAGKQAEIIIEQGDAEQMRFPNGSFHAVTIGFGTRNFTNLQTAFTEIHRVLSPGGIFVNLELSSPRRFPMKQLYTFYSKFIVPLIGKTVSKHGEAYAYLPDSIRRFPEREAIVGMLRSAGFAEAKWKDLTAGIVTMHIAVK